MRYHFIGIGGVGMSALARIMLEKGHEVSGSDTKESCVTEGLARAGAHIFYQHRKENVPPNSIVVYSTAIKRDNLEWREGMLHRSELLEQLLFEKDAILVVGAHGKTTSTTLLTHLVRTLDPSFVIGGFSPSLDDVNGHRGQGPVFIAEGDESDGSFLRARPKGAIITNVDFDHLDYWKTEEALLAAYKQFIGGVQEPDLLFYRHDDYFLSQWNIKGVPFGESPKAALQIRNIRDRLFDIEFQGRTYNDVGLSLLGRHNIFNAAGCFGMALALGASEDTIREGLLSFKGVKRRLEWKGSLNGAPVYDDYAHHPEEIQATLAALKSAFGKRRLVAIFQPHRYTRFRDFMEAFTQAWKDSDELIVTDIYGAGEAAIEGVTIERFLEKVKASYSQRSGLVDFVKSKVLPGDVVVTLGAGDITKVSRELVV